jgi:hypothetical protein
MQGLKAYLEQERPDLKTAGVVLSYDGRHNSRRWARLAAGVFIRSEVPVYLFETTTPTPFVPYTVVKVRNIFYSNIIILTSLIEAKIVVVYYHRSSVGDPGCLSRMPDPDFYPSRIPDPKTAMKDW